MDKLFLIYINYIGKNHKGKHLYEFIFSDTKENIDGESWDEVPAAGRPDPPFEVFIKEVGKLESNLKLDTVQNSDTFAVWDAVDGIIALAWENVNAYESYPDHRLGFKFGQTLKDVEDVLYGRDLKLDYDKKFEKK